MENQLMSMARRVSRNGACALVILLLVGCSDALDPLLEVELPGQVAAAGAERPGKAASIVEGAVTIFNCALTRHIHEGGLLGDELAQGASGQDHDGRAFRAGYSPKETGNCGTYYGTVSEARWYTDHGLQLLEGW